MGLLTGLLTFPLAPVRGTIWVAEQVLDQAESQYYDPSVIRRQLEDIDELRSTGQITEDEAEAMEDALVERLMESRRRSAEKGH